MVQTLSPTSTVSAGSWTGGHVEVATDDDSYAISEAANNGPISTLEVGLASGGDPVSSADHVIRVRWKASGGGGAHATPPLCELVQGTTIIATLTGTSPLGTTEVEDTLTLSGAEADSISDYSDLRLRFRSENVRRSLYVDLGQFEIPDAGTPSFTGTVAVTQEAQTSTISGTVVEPAITGTAAPTQADQTSAISGTVSVSYPGNLPEASVIGWWDARDLTGAHGVAVSSWADKGPKGQDPLMEATGSLQPLISTSGFGGIKSVEFDGVDDRLDMDLDQSYTGDVGIIAVFEVLTFPAVSNPAGVVYSTGSAVPNKIILGTDDQGPSGFVFMVTGGAAADHITDTNDLAYLEATPSRFVITQFVQDSTETLKVWENGAVLIDLDEGEALNNLPGLKLGIREDNTRPGHVRIASVLLVDMAFATQSELLAAQDDLASEFSVPLGDFVGSATPTQADQTSSASGTVTVPEFTGTVAVTQDAQTSTAAGTVAPPAFTGTATPTQDDQTSAAEGSITSPSVSGSAAVTQDNQTSEAAGTFTPAPVTGTVGVTQASQTAEAAGTATEPGFSGSVAATQDDQTSDATGTVAPPAFTGTVAVVQDDQTSTATGEVTSAGFAGSVAVTQENQVSEATGVFTPAGITGSTVGVQADQTSTISGTVVNPSFTGTVAVTQEAQIGVATGTTTPPAFTGTVNVTQEDQVGRASSPGLRTRLEGRSVSGFGTEGFPSGVGLEGTKL